jgi:outer membrane protein assembly factor BamB
VERHGVNPNESTIGVGNVGNLRQVWSLDLGGHINTAAVVANGVGAKGTPADVAYVGTEHGGFFAIDVKNGDILWKKQFPTQRIECAESPDGIFGISAAAAIDPSKRRVYVATVDGKVHALDLSTGAEAAGWPVVVAEDSKTDFVWGAPTLWKGQLYVGTASHCEIGPHEGRVLSIDTATATRSHVFWVTGPGPPIGGSVWGWGGVSVDPKTGDVFAASGPANNFPENVPYGDHVLRLTRDLQLRAAHAPPVRPGLFDDDFGSTPVLFQRKGCPPQLAVMRKQGTLYVYDRDSIAKGPSQTLNMSGAPYQFIGLPAFWPAENLLYVANPSPGPDQKYTHGMVAFRLESNCRLKLAWQETAGRNDTVVSTPTIANGVVYYGDGKGNPQLHAFDAKSGKPLWSSPPSDFQDAVFAAPVVVNGTLLQGSWDNHLHAYRP